MVIPNLYSGTDMTYLAGQLEPSILPSTYITALALTLIQLENPSTTISSAIRLCI